MTDIDELIEILQDMQQRIEELESQEYKFEAFLLGREDLRSEMNRAEKAEQRIKELEDRLNRGTY